MTTAININIHPDEPPVVRVRSFVSFTELQIGPVSYFLANNAAVRQLAAELASAAALPERCGE